MFGPSSEDDSTPASKGLAITTGAFGASGGVPQDHTFGESTVATPTTSTNAFGSVAPRDFLKETGPGFNLLASSGASQATAGPSSFPQNTSLFAPSIPAPGAKRDPTREETENELLSALARLGLGHITLADLSKLDPPDMYEMEMELMAEVRAYFSISYKRITDYVPLAIDHTFLHAFMSALQTTLISKLRLGTETQNCEAYLAEDADVAAERTELEGRMRRLESVREELLRWHETS